MPVELTESVLEIAVEEGLVAVKLRDDRGGAVADDSILRMREAREAEREDGEANSVHCGSSLHLMGRMPRVFWEQTFGVAIDSLMRTFSPHT